MNRTFVVLLVLALTVWGYAVAQFLSGYFGGIRSWNLEKTAESNLTPLPTTHLTRPPLDTAFRDPFLSYLYAQKPVPKPTPKPTPKPARPALVVIEPPRAKLGGILWGDSPVAILKQDGRTELVKEGGEAFNLKIKRIERHQVTVLLQGRSFVLEY